MTTLSKIDCDDFVHVESPFSSYCFEKCTYSGVMIGSPPKKLFDKLKFSDITLNDCKVVSSIIYAADFRNIKIHNLGVKKGIDICHAFFDSCVISGKIGAFLILDCASRINSNPQLELDVLECNKNQYSKIDWALDISNADFTSFDCRSVPAEKIIINKNTQIAVNLKRMKEIRSFPDDDMKSIWESNMKFVNRDFTGYNFVLTTSKRTKRHEEELKFFDFIRENGCELKRHE